MTTAVRVPRARTLSHTRYLMPKATSRRVVCLLTDGRKIYGHTTKNHDEANALLTDGVYHFGLITKTKSGFTVRNGKRVTKITGKTELCFFPVQ